MAQPKVVKMLDGAPALTRSITVADTTALAAIAVGDPIKLSSGNAIVWADGSAQKLHGISLGRDVGEMQSGIVPTAGIDRTGSDTMGAFGPTTTAIKIRYVALRSGTIIEMDSKANQTTTNVAGTEVGITGSTGAWVADTAGTTKVGVVHEVVKANTASATGIVRIKLYDSALNTGG